MASRFLSLFPKVLDEIDNAGDLAGRLAPMVGSFNPAAGALMATVGGIAGKVQSPGERTPSASSISSAPSSSSIPSPNPSPVETQPSPASPASGVSDLLARIGALLPPSVIADIRAGKVVTVSINGASLERAAELFAEAEAEARNFVAGIVHVGTGPGSPIVPPTQTGVTALRFPPPIAELDR